MIILISDLHLSDDPAHSTLNVGRLLDHLKHVIDGARGKGIREITLVLLGDIFETLRSVVWVERRLRPWEGCTAAHVDAVSEIVRRIVAANEVFFERLSALVEAAEGHLHLLYIPGNHDRLMNTEMGAGARGLILSKLPSLRASDGKPFSDPDDRFPKQLVDEEHQLVARHGHEFDPANRYEDGRAAVGDAVVIEFVQRLPMRVRQRLPMKEDDDTLSFLDEMDNVRPHSLKVLVDWMHASLAGRKDIRARVVKEVENALGETLDEILALKRSVSFGSFAGVERRVDLLLQALRGLNRRTTLKTIARVLPGDSSAPPYPTFALDVLRLSQSLGGKFRYFVCGHTHDPVVVPLDPGRPVADRARHYINTGTWRRVYRVADSVIRPGRAQAFSCVEEGCAAIIYSPEEQRLVNLPFDFQQLTTVPRS
jgi:UDP-2,3-diacylglucosamine pyrophosphatase LpxH